MTELTAWLTEARSIASTADLPGVLADLRAVQAHTARPAFRAVVLGERGRGKTTLINRLLGTEAVPPDPPCPVPVLVAGDTADRLEVRDVGGTTPLEPGAWPDLTGRDHATVRRGLVSELLTGLDLELVDTPAVNDTAAEEPESVRAVVGGADAALLVVFATAALSLTETRFLTDVVLALDIPHVAVVVTRLDQVEAEERDEVRAFIVERARSVSPRITVLEAADDGVAPVAEWLTAAARDADRPRLRGGALAARLARAMRDAAALTGAAAESDRLDADARAEADARARATLAEELLVFDGLRVELRQRQHHAAARFRGHLTATRERLAEVLRYELNHSPDPRLWWERDLPYRLRRELAVTAKEYERSLLAGVEIDLSWLRERLAERFALRPEGLDVTLDALRAPRVDPEELQLENMRNRRIAYRVGPLGLALLVATLGAGLVPFATIGATAAGVVFGEVLLRNAVDRQRTVAERHLGPLIDRVLAEFGDAISEALRTLYDQLLAEAVRRRRSWHDDRVHALAAPGAPQTRDWAGLTARATRLADEIETALKTNGAEG